MVQGPEFNQKKSIVKTDFSIEYINQIQKDLNNDNDNEMKDVSVNNTNRNRNQSSVLTKNIANISLIKENFKPLWVDK